MIPFNFQFHFSGAQRNMEEFIDIRSVVNQTEVREGLRIMFLHSGFANESNGGYRLLPCATGTFVNSSERAPKCQKMPRR